MALWKRTLRPGQPWLGEPKELYHVAGFAFGPNPMHPSRTLSAGEQRWIAWWVPPSVPPSCCAPLFFDYTRDNSPSDVPLCTANHTHSFLYTVRDLTALDVAPLRALRDFAVSKFRERYGAKEEDVEMYFHYPVRPPLAVLHLHVCVGHREVGGLAGRSHALRDVIASLEKNGCYDARLSYDLVDEGRA